MIRRCTLLIFIFLIGYSLDGLALDTRLFPKPAAIEKDVEFWKRVYTEVTTDEGFIHDNAKLGVVYEKVSIPDNYSRRARYRYIKRIKEKYEGILRTLSRGKRSGLSREEQRVLNLWPKGVSNKELRHATNRIRFQLGQANKFRAGLIRSGSWKPYILKTLDKMGLPREIAALPHVESSFNHKAYSKVGAAGMWQFTRSTGRRFMRIDHIMDERMDPFEATIAAARLLENNYAVTGAWPLAMTAYNHGAAGMRRAAQKLGTRDIVTVLRKYRSRTFGFASRNFYVAFLAAVEIDENPEKYFGELQLNPPVDYEFIKLPGYMSINTVMQLTNLSLAELRETNPALRPSVWNGNKYLPKGYDLRINRREVTNVDDIAKNITNASSRLMFAKQKPDRYHRVRRGQTLSTIAARYGTSIRDLVALNNLRSRHRIRVGQVLRLPQGRDVKRAPRMVAENRSPKVEPRAIPASGTYRVRRGDTVESIARKYGVSTSEILAFNNIRNKNRIYPGQRLTIAKPDGSTYIVQSGDSIERIADIYGVSISQVLAMNDISNKNRIYPGQKLLIAQPTGETHIVQRGDSIDSIATRYGVSVSRILTLNNIRNKNRIYPGQKILLAKAETNENTATDAAENVTVNIADEEEQDEPIKVARVNIEKGSTTNPEDSEQADDTKVALAVPLESSADDEPVEAQAEDADEGPIAINDDEEQMKSVLGVATDETMVTLQAEGEEEGVAVATVDETLTNTENGLQEESDAESINDSIADAAMSESDTELLADPTDYSVSKRNTIEVQAAETLGHYAEWLKLRASDLRRINHMRYGRPVVIGKRLKLKFSKVTPEEFEEQRIAYHRSLQEEFFEQFQINGSEKHKIRRGQSVWKLAKRTYKIPIWLLRQYNPDLDMDRIRPGTIITFPKITERTDTNDSSNSSAKKSEKNAQKVAVKVSESGVQRRANVN